MVSDVPGILTYTRITMHLESNRNSKGKFHSAEVTGRKDGVKLAMKIENGGHRTGYMCRYLPIRSPAGLEIGTSKFTAACCEFR